MVSVLSPLTTSSVTLTYYEGDTLPPMAGQILYDDGSGPFDTTDGVVSITIAPPAGTGTIILGDLVTMTDPANGEWFYQLPEPLQLQPGTESTLYQGQLAITFSGGYQRRTSIWDILILRGVGE